MRRRRPPVVGPREIRRGGHVEKPEGVGEDGVGQQAGCRVGHAPHVRLEHPVDVIRLAADGQEPCAAQRGIEKPGARQPRRGAPTTKPHPRGPGRCDGASTSAVFAFRLPAGPHSSAAIPGPGALPQSPSVRKQPEVVRHPWLSHARPHNSAGHPVGTRLVLALAWNVRTLSVTLSEHPTAVARERGKWRCRGRGRTVP